MTKTAAEAEERRAWEWIHAQCEAHGVTWKTLSLAEQRDLTRAIPCNLRCWRVGGAVDTTPGQPCPECGRPVPHLSLWERLVDDEHGPMDPHVLRTVDGREI